MFRFRLFLRTYCCKLGPRRCATDSLLAPSTRSSPQRLCIHSRLVRRGFMAEPTLHHQRSRAPSVHLNTTSGGDACHHSKVEEQQVRGYNALCCSFLVSFFRSCSGLQGEPECDIRTYGEAQTPALSAIAQQRNNTRRKRARSCWCGSIAHRAHPQANERWLHQPVLFDGSVLDNNQNMKYENDEGFLSVFLFPVVSSPLFFSLCLPRSRNSDPGSRRSRLFSPILTTVLALLHGGRRFISENILPLFSLVDARGNAPTTTHAIDWQAL